METAIIDNDYSSGLPFNKVMDTFFLKNKPEKVKILFWKLFQCYVTKDCDEKAEMPNQEIALFYDQLMDLVAAAYILHEANRALKPGQEGSEHE